MGFSLRIADSLRHLMHDNCTCENMRRPQRVERRCLWPHPKEFVCYAHLCKSKCNAELTYTLTHTATSTREVTFPLCDANDFSFFSFFERTPPLSWSARSTSARHQLVRLLVQTDKKALFMIQKDFLLVRRTIVENKQAHM